MLQAMLQQYPISLACSLINAISSSLGEYSHASPYGHSALPSFNLKVCVYRVPRAMLQAMLQQHPISLACSLINAISSTLGEYSHASPYGHSALPSFNLPP